MSSLKQVGQATIQRLRSVPELTDWEMDWFERDPFPGLPYLCLDFDKAKSGDFGRNLGTYTKWWPRVCLYYNLGEQPAAYETIGDLIDPAGVVVNALKARGSDAFQQICGGDGFPNIRATTSRGPMFTRRPHGRYLYGSIGFEMGTR